MKQHVLRFLLGMMCSGSIAWSGGAWANSGSVYGVAPPAVYPAQTWQGRSEAVVRVLNRLDAHVSELTVPVGQEVQYRSVSIRAVACLERPPTLPADAAVRLHIEETKAQNVPVFEGWMFANAPTLGVYENPLYDVQPVRCQGENVAPQPGPLPQTHVPSLGVVETPHVDADQEKATGSIAPQPQSGGGPMSLLPPTAPAMPTNDNASPSSPPAKGSPTGMP